MCWKNIMIFKEKIQNPNNNIKGIFVLLNVWYLIELLK